MGVRSSRWLLLVSTLGATAAFCVALVVGSTSGADSSPPSPSTVSTPAPVSSEERPSPGTEVVDRRTEDSKTFERPDGAMVTRLYPQPVHFRDGGRWRSIDNTLVDAGGGYVHRMANDGDALIPRDLGDPFKVNKDGVWVSFSLQDADQAAEAVLSGATARFDDVAPETSAAYEAVNDGLKETLTLASAQARRVFVYDVSASAGLSGHEASDGSIRFTDDAGHVRFAFSAPVAWDAADPAAVSHASTLHLAATPDGWRVTLAVDDAWLDDPARVFPVTVDPNVQWPAGGAMRYSGAQRDCTVSSATPATSLCADPGLTVGSTSTGSYKSLLYFNTRSAIPQDAEIFDATLLMHVGSTGTAPASNLRLRPLTASWTNAATWSTTDGSTAWTAPGGDVSTTAADASPAVSVSSLNAWYYWTIPAGVVQDWIDGSRSDFGLQVAADAGSPTQTYTFESTDGDPYKWPAVDIYWEEDQGTKSSYTLDTQRLSDNSQLAVNVANGDLVYSAADASLSGVAGLELRSTRVWDSVDNWTPGLYGYGWTDNNHLQLVHDDKDGSVYLADQTGAHYRFAPSGSGTFTTPPGIDGTLCAIGVAAGCTRDGVNAGIKYKLTDNSTGRRTYFWPSGVVGVVKDAGSNAVTFDYESDYHQINGTQGTHLRFDRPGDGYATSLTDGTHTTTFTRGGTPDPDFLQSVTDDDNNTTHYEYNDDGYLTKVTDPQGRETHIEWEEVPDFGSWRATKITRVLDPSDPTDPTKNPTTTYAYDPGSRTTVVTDPAGNATPDDTTGGQTTYTYDKKLHITSASPRSSALPSAPWPAADSGWDTTRPSSDPTGAWHDLAGGYVDGQGTTDVTLGATDPAGAGGSVSGVRRVALEEGDDGGQPLASSSTCSDPTNPPRTCPTTVTKTLAVDESSLSEGAHRFRQVTQDLAGETSASGRWTVFVDRTAPRPASNLGVKAYMSSGGGSATLTWGRVGDPRLADGSDGSGTADYTVRYRVDGGTWSSWTATGGPNAVTLTGVHAGQDVDLELSATDQVGNTSAVTSGHATIGAYTPVTGSTRLGLEKFWDYDTTDTGAGSQLLVNSDTGNLVWHDVPIVNPGRGLSTYVNLDYNSLEHPAAMGTAAGIDPLGTVTMQDSVTYNVAGRGVSISVSGPTRVNEPLGGVAAADVRDGVLGAVSGLPSGFGNNIVLTDADGTQHHFLRDTSDDDKWIAPPGVHLTLRRWGTAGDPLTGKSWVMTRADGVAYFFNKLGYLIRTEDRNGNALTYTYDKLDLLTGATGTAATACSAGAIVGAASGSPSSTNGWGLQNLLKASGTSSAGKLCALRLKKVTDPAGRDLTLTYVSRSSGDQATLDDALDDVINKPGNGSIDVQGLLCQAAGTLTTLGHLIAPTPLAKIVDHAGREYTFDYTDGDLTSFVEVANAGSLAPAGDRARRWAFDYFSADDTSDTHRLKNVTEVRDTDEGDDRSTQITYQTRAGTAPSGQDAALVPATVTDRRGKVTTYSFSDYGASPRELAITDPRAKIWRRDVDQFGRPVAITDPLGDQTVLGWDAGSPRRNDLVRVAEGVKGGDPGAVTAMTYEPVGGRLLTQTTYPDGEDHPETARKTELSYALSSGQPSLRPTSDPNDDFVVDLTDIKLPRTLDGGDHVGTKYTVDTETGDVTATSDQDGSAATSADYCDGTDCPRGLVKREADEVGDVTTYGGFDDNGLPQTMVDPKGNDIAGGNPTPAGHPGAAHAAEHRWLYRYDEVGNLLSVSDPRNADAQSNPAAGTPAAAYTTKFTYDAFDRVVQQVTPKKSSSSQYITETWSYDRNGNQLGNANAGTGRSTTATFSPTDQPLAVAQRAWSRDDSDAKGNTYANRDEITTFSYDDADLLVSRTDPRGASGAAGGGSPTLPYTTEWTRDEAGRVVAESRHASSSVHVQSFALDPRGNIVGEIDAARNADPNGDGSTADARTPAAGAAAAAAAISSDDLSALRMSAAYNRADEVTSQTERPAPTDSSGSPRTDRYVYDADGNVVKHVLPRDDHDVPAGVTAGAGTVANTYTYDRRDQLVKTTDPTGAVSAVTRRADGKVASQTTPRGVAAGNTDDDGVYSYFTTKYSYDAAGDLLTRTIPHAPNQYGRGGWGSGDYQSWKVSYGRDVVGNPATITDGRGKVITNDFLDTGQLASTSRPSWWQLSWGGSAGAQDPGRHFADPADAPAVPVGGPQLTERETPLSGADTSSEQPSSTAHGKFGAVTPADAPDWLPRAGSALFGYDDDGHLTTVADGALTTSRIDYDPTGRVVGTTQPLGTGAGATRSSGDPLPCDRRTGGCQGVIAHRYDYDPDGNLTKSQLLGDGAWHSDFTYDSFDRLTSRTDPGASDVPEDWSTATPSREETQYAYDANDNLVTRVTPRGVASAATGDYEYTYTYDTLDRLTSETNPTGDRWGYAWDVDDDLIRELTPNGSAKPASQQDDYKTLRSYDAADRLLTEQGPVVGGTRNTITNTYFPDGAIESRTDPGATAEDGGSDVPRLTGYDYDGRGLLYRVTQGHLAGGGAGFSMAGDGPRTTLTEYDANGNVRRVVNPSGVTMSGSGSSQSWAPTHRDHLGDNLTSTSSTDAVNATVYDYVDTDSGSGISAGDNGAPRAIYQPRADTSDSVLTEKLDYDTLGRIKTIWNVGNVNATPAFTVHTSYARLANGWISGSQDFSGSTTQRNGSTYNYDQNGNQLRWVLDPDVTSSTNTTSEIDRTYWPNGQMKTRAGSTTPSSAHDYSYWYDPNEALTGVRDPDRARMVFIGRDGAERTASTVQRYGSSTSSSDAGASDWQRGRDSAFDYDHDGNVLLRRTNGVLDRSTNQMVDASSGGVRSYTHFTYDGEDKETVGAFYEPTRVAGNPTIDDATCAPGGSPPSGVRCVRTTYHPSGQRRTRRQQDQTLVTTYFDDFGQPTQRRRQAGGVGADIVTSYTYDIRGNRTSDSPGVGTYQYNARDQLTSWKRGTDFNANGVDHHDWTVDYVRNPDGSIDHTTEKNAGGSVVKTKTYHYTGQRLDNIQSTTPGSSTSTWDLYDHNEFDSVVGIKTGASGATTPTFSAPPAAKDEDCTAALGATASDTTLYCYDQFDRLLRQRSPGAGEEQTFTYDGMDRRDTRTDHDGTSSPAKSGFKYLGGSSTISGQQVPTGASSSVSVAFDRDSAGQPLAVTLQAGSASPVTKTYATDANGNPTGLENSDGSVPAANRYVYDPYGDLDVNANASLTGDAATNPLRFNGFDYDSAVKTYDMQARDYRPDVGRFLQTDRYESAQSDLSLVADPLTQNRYDFVGGDPVNSVEFNGHAERIGDENTAPNSAYNGKTGHVTTARRSEGIAAQRSSRRRGSEDENLVANSQDRLNQETAEELTQKKCRGCSDHESSGTYDDIYARLSQGNYAGISLPGPGSDSFVGGLANAAGETFSAITHPGDTFNGLAYAGSHPGQAVSALAHSCDNRTVASCAGYALGGAVGPKGVGKLKALSEVDRAVTRVGGEGRTLYRAVEPKEARDISDNQAFRPSPYGGEVKYFYGSADAAERFAAAMNKRGFNYTHIAAGEVAPDMLAELGRPTLTGIESGEAYTVPNPHLPRVRNARVQGPVR